MLYLLFGFFTLLLIFVRYFLGKTSVHIDFFLFGVFYYFFVPGIVSVLALFADSPGVDEWFVFSQVFFKEYQFDFILLVALWVTSFLAGCLCVALTKNMYSMRYVEAKNQSPQAFLSYLIVLFLFLVLFFYLYIGRGVLFGGYSNYDATILGGIATISLLSYGTFLSVSRGASYFLSFLLISLLVILSVVLLLSGSRMYVLVPITGFVAMGLLRFRQLKARAYIFLLVFLFAGFFLVFGVLRSATLTLSDSLYVLIAEPVFTSYSLVSFWRYNDLQFFEFPRSFFSSFLNLVPSLIWPGKDSYIYDLAAQGYYTYAPLGAESICASLLANFGVIGSALFVAAIGAFLHFLYIFRGRQFVMAAYLGAVSLIPFMFFRDPFSVFFKSMTLVSFIIPLLFFVSAVLNEALKRRLNKQ